MDESLAEAADPGAELLAWSERETREPDWRRTIARRLGQPSGDMQAFWKLPAVKKAKLEPLTLLAVVFEASQRAYFGDANRASEHEEQESFVRVKRAADALKTAIETSSLPADTFTPIEIRSSASDGGEVMSTNLLLGWRWRKPPSPSIVRGSPVAVTDLMDAVTKLVDRHIEMLAPRLVHRARSRFEETAFCRALNHLLEREAELRSDSAIAYIATAVLDLTEAIDGLAVKDMLRR